MWDPTFSKWMFIPSDKVRAICDGQVFAVNATSMCDIDVDFSIEELSTTFFKISSGDDIEDKTLIGIEIDENNIKSEAFISNSHASLEIKGFNRKSGEIEMVKKDFANP